jgi:hypothetical protein
VKAVALRNENLAADQIDAGHDLRDRVLDRIRG